MALDKEAKLKKQDAFTLIPQSNSAGSKWIIWHKALKKKFGKRQANIIWLKAWEVRGGKGTSASTSDLRTYMEENGVNLETTSLEDVADFGVSVGDAFELGFNVYKWLMIALGISVVGGVAILIFNVASKPIETLNSASKLMGKGK